MTGDPYGSTRRLVFWFLALGSAVVAAGALALFVWVAELVTHGG